MSGKKDRGLGNRTNFGPNQYPKGKNYLLVIGIDEYNNGIPRLNNAVKDAQAFKDLLLDSFQFEQENVLFLSNERATKEGILDAFDKLMLEMTDQDNLIFFYSGHGEFFGPTQRGYWIPFDAVLDRRSTYLSNSEVIDFISSAKARHIVGIADSCFSAALFAQRNLNPEASRQYSLPSRYLITSGRLEPVSDGSLGKNSPFAAALIDYMKYSNGDYIWVTDLRNKLINHTKYDVTKQLPQGEPLQSVGHRGGEFVFLRKDGVVPATKEQNADIEQLEAGQNYAQTGTRQATERIVQEVVPQTLPQLKSHLKNLAAKNLEKALDDINSRLRDNSYMVNDFILLSAQFNQLKGDKARGIIPYNDSVVRQNQIIASFQSLVDDLEEEDINW
ncbi:MAG TPA: caspase family protein [Flavilitoribacter sp.]|nr:caspase family protein [Flavilitoribacter sp.]HMQ86633.1 caspase family protein [Flavilitoribacter sp.]